MVIYLFYLYVVLIILGFLGDKTLDYLNIRHRREELPASIRDVYQEDKYKKQQAYESANDRLNTFSGFVSVLIILLMLFFNGFAFLDAELRKITEHAIWLPILFFLVIMVVSNIINVPFSYYKTFVIEQRFGFNKMNRFTFTIDKIKTWIVGGVFGGGLFVLVLFFYGLTTDYFWILAWFLITAFTIFMTMFYSRLIVPLFNKQTPLEDGPLKDAIREFAEKTDFKLDSIFLIDGSKRSTKANAYFTGMGNKKRIVLYDTLLNDLTNEEIVAVLAHEIGHYKMKHTPKQLLLSIGQLGITLFILSLFLKYSPFSQALGVDGPSFHIGLIAFGILYNPISTFLGVGINAWSRKHEYEADFYAGSNGYSAALISALKKLSVNNLSNINPHPLYVSVYYSHPPLWQRIDALNEKLLRK